MLPFGMNNPMLKVNYGGRMIWTSFDGQMILLRELCLSPPTEGIPGAVKSEEQDLRHLLMVMFFCEVNENDEKEETTDDEAWYPTLATKEQLEAVVWYLTQIKLENRITSLKRPIDDAIDVWTAALAAWQA